MSSSAETDGNSAEETAKIDSSGYHSGSDRDSSSVGSAVMSDSGEATSHEYTPADKQENLKGVGSGEQACERIERRVDTVYAYLCTMRTCWMKCVMLLAAVYGFIPINIQLYPRKTHIAKGLAISCIMTCCVLHIMSPEQINNMPFGQNAPATTNNFDMQLGAQTKHWEDKTVATKCSKCGKARKTEPVEGTAMAAAATSTAGKTPLTVENEQEAVVKVLATQAPTAAAFAGMHEFERGNGFGLKEHTAFGAIAEGVTDDQASPGGVGTGEDIDSRPRREPSRGPNQAATIHKWLPWLSLGMGLLSMVMMVMAQLMAHVGDMGTEVVYSIRWAAARTLAVAGYAGAFACAARIHGLVFISVMGLFPADAYSQ